MPRLARKNLGTSFFHIIVQGINREYIFNKNEYIERYLYLLGLNIKKENCAILAYCIMNNHAHILLYTEKTDSMSKTMQKTNTSYARYYNKQENRVGYVFRDRYYTQAIKDEEQLFTCLAYIHNNPVNANIVQNAYEYKYSTYNQYMERQGIINDEIVKIIFGTTKGYIETFEEIHKNLELEGIIDVVPEFEDYSSIIRKHTVEGKIQIENIKKDKDALKKLIKDLKNKAGLSLRKISEVLELNKDKVCKIFNEEWKLDNNSVPMSYNSVPMSFFGG